MRMRKLAARAGFTSALLVGCSSDEPAIQRAATVDATGGLGPQGGQSASGGATGGTGAVGVGGGPGGRASGGAAPGGAATSGGASGTAGSRAGAGGASPADAGIDAGGSGGQVVHACSSAIPLPSGTRTCRTQSDCGNYYSCAHDSPGDGQCDLFCASGGECTGDADCPPQFVCNEIQTTCQCGRTIRRCQSFCSTGSCGSTATCTSDGHCSPISCLGGQYQCPAGTLCGFSPQVDSHGCRPAQCNTVLGGDGYVCAAGFECSPTGAGADSHGCVPIPCPSYACAPNFDCVPGAQDLHGCVRRDCSNDESCDCGACISGKCQDRLFGCFPPPPP